MPFTHPDHHKNVRCVDFDPPVSCLWYLLLPCDLSPATGWADCRMTAAANSCVTDCCDQRPGISSRSCRRHVPDVPEAVKMATQPHVYVLSWTTRPRHYEASFPVQRSGKGHIIECKWNLKSTLPPLEVIHAATDILTLLGIKKGELSESSRHVSSHMTCQGSGPKYCRQLPCFHIPWQMWTTTTNQLLKGYGQNFKNSS